MTRPVKQIFFLICALLLGGICYGVVKASKKRLPEHHTILEEGTREEVGTTSSQPRNVLQDFMVVAIPSLFISIGVFYLTNRCYHSENGGIKSQEVLQSEKRLDYLMAGVVGLTFYASTQFLLYVYGAF